MFQVTSSGGSQAIAALEHRASRLANMGDRLDRASDYVYEATRQRFDAEGEGEWPQLSESTVAKKESQGYGEPARILFAEGNLYESVSSPNGPYSLRMHVRNATAETVIMVVDFDQGGWQIPVVLSEGNDRLPARPIWPAPEQVKDGVARILMEP